MKSSISWDLLITAIPHRYDRLCETLAYLDKQISRHPTVGARIFYDNLQTGYGDKTQALLESSRADYVSCFDDDDSCAPDFISRVMTTIWCWAEDNRSAACTWPDGFPDYVGFPVRYTCNGEARCRVEHRLSHGRWENTPSLLIRDIAQFNPIKREIALLGRWEEPGYEAERRWGDQVRGSGKCKTEAWIEQEMYYYQENTGDTFKTSRGPWPEPIPKLPDYPWLTKIGPYA